MKKLFAVLIVAIFLVTAVGAVSAADSISVNAVGSDLQDPITVSLVCDGKVVDTAKLSSSNSWKTTFNVNDDGNYQLKVADSSDYSFSVSGNAEKGFVVSAKLINQDTLGSTDGEELEVDDSSAELETTEATPIAENESGDSDDNATDNDTAKNNDTDKKNDTSKKNDTTKKNDTNKKNDPVKKEDTVKKEPKKQVVKQKKEPKKQKTNSKHKSGFPIAVLVVAAMAAVFVPFTRKK